MAGPLRNNAPRRVLGMMSGTSLDGVDAALLLTDGEAVIEAGASAFRPYSDAERAVLHAALGRWPGEPGVSEAAAVVENAHAEVAAGFDGVDLVAFHGQTLAHAPAAGRTHQAGDGAVLAGRLGLPVVWDFRSADMALGGQGAPLAPFYHFALARSLGRERLAFLNLGGVANLTIADPACEKPEAEGALVAFDCGPANAPLDDLSAARGVGPRDEGGALAAMGRADGDVVAAFLADPFHVRMPPKSLDRNAFDWLIGRLAGHGTEDALATLVACAVAGVGAGLSMAEVPPVRLLVTGGGRHNRALMAALCRALPLQVTPVESAGLDGDMLEAQAFAYLGLRVLRGLPTSCPGTTGVAAAVGGGIVSRPG